MTLSVMNICLKQARSRSRGHNKLNNLIKRYLEEAMRFAFNRPLSQAGLITSTGLPVEVFYFGLYYLEDNRMNGKISY